eukprot:TRINITY_DN7763_c0_g2_i1.p1 TRINITY_DN7763_c0_g2~~TRINITY_DN7763_c0_g2_i1.p1  ORF type:complete len:619 (+),score=87.26 TRINITY_DN7763_c0_g2_i1:48-1859(+)
MACNVVDLGFFGPASQLFFEMLTPMGILVFFAVASAVGAMLKKPVHKPFMFNTVGTMVSGLFIAFSRMTLGLFLSERMPNGEETLKAFPTVIMHSKQWQSMLPIGFLSFTIYSVGFLCYCTRAIILAPSRAKDREFLEQYRFLFKFSPDCFWWLLVPLLIALSMNIVQVVINNSPLDLLYLQFLLLGFYAVMVVFHRPYKHRINNYVELALKSSLVVINVLATSFAPALGEAGGSKEQGLYEVVIFATLVLAASLGVAASSSWALQGLFGLASIDQRQTRGREVDMLLRYRDIIMESFLRDDIMQNASQLVDEDLRVLDHACRILVPVLFKKQCHQNLFKQRIIPGAPFEVWNGRSCTTDVMGGVFTGNLYPLVEENYKTRLNLYTLAEELHNDPCGKDLFSRVMHESIQTTVLDDQAAASNVARSTAKIPDCSTWLQTLSRFLGKGMISKQAFSTAVSDHTILSEEELSKVFDLVADGQGKASKDDLCKLLNSAYAACPKPSQGALATIKRTIRTSAMRVLSMNSETEQASKVVSSKSQSDGQQIWDPPETEIWDPPEAEVWDPAVWSDTHPAVWSDTRKDSKRVKITEEASENASEISLTL